MNNVTNKQIALAGAGLAALGTIGPWATVTTVFFSMTVNGTDGDGKILLPAVLVLAWMIYNKFGSALMSKATVAAGAALTAYSVWTFVRIADMASDGAGAEFITQAGWGLYAMILGGLTLVVAGVRSRTDRHSAVEALVEATA